ncbi:aminopeptidase [Miltoncostaea oceani]|uniref:aminopeptidase n=1 Tax=Miltoncostaea oceani TaxID=2843216 RepID=UPI001C3E4D82|nr:aminopeptidase [Miltoncostaea oceani]
MRAGDCVVIDTPGGEPEAVSLAVSLAEAAYRRGASEVIVATSGPTAQLLRQSGVPAHDAAGSEAWAEAAHAPERHCLITVNDGEATGDPMRHLEQLIDDDHLPWSMVYAPSLAVARAAYDEVLAREGADAAVRAYAVDLLRFSRCGPDDPPGAWETHVQALHARSRHLNGLDLEAIQIEDPDNGTDLRVGLLETSAFSPCEWATKDGRRFGCNIPSEEIFCSPDPAQCEGTLSISRPITMTLGPEQAADLALSDATVVISALQGRMKGGALTREGFGASVPALRRAGLEAEEINDIVWGLLDVDAGSLRPGELALVPSDGRIGSSERVFGVTNLDENAGLHLALGLSYRAGMAAGHEDDPRRNRSGVHQDLTLGTPGMRVSGISRDGTRSVLMENGCWTI